MLHINTMLVQALLFVDSRRYLTLSELSETKLVPTREILLWAPTRMRIVDHLLLIVIGILLLIPLLKVIPTREV